jgi:hypothetical protein
MLTALEYLEIKNRMTKSDNHGECGISCGSCPLASGYNNKNISCVAFQKIYPKEAIEVVEQWDKDHPVKTIKDDFLEKYPDAIIGMNNAPTVCTKSLGYPSEGCNGLTCYECWNRPLE